MLSFQQGEEVQENQPQIEESGAVDLESRMVIMEDALARMAVGVEKLLEEKKRPSALKTKPERVTFEPSVAAGSMSSTSAAPKDVSSPKKKKVPPSGQLDPAVVAAALQAGIPRESIQQMEMLVGSNAKAKKVKDMNPDVVPIWDPLSEEEEDESGENPVEGSGLEGSADPVSRTLSKLAGIMELLTEEKKKKSSSSRLDQVLDAAGSSSGDGLSLGSGKKVAAARRALRTAFQEQPSEVHQAIEKLLYEDLNTATLGPGMKPAGFNARSWVEFRSHIGAYKATAHSAWAIAGVIDSLVAHNYDRARAQACLLFRALPTMAVGILLPSFHWKAFRLSQHTGSTPGTKSCSRGAAVQQVVGAQMGGDNARASSRARRLRSKTQNSGQGTQEQRGGGPRCSKAGKSEGSPKNQTRSDGVDQAEEPGFFCMDEGVADDRCEPVRLPGSSASTLKVASLLNSLPRLLLKTKSGFQGFLQSLVQSPSLRQQTTSTSSSTTWPMPLPYPEVFMSGSHSSVPNSHLRRLVCLQIAAFDWLVLGCPGGSPSELRLGGKLAASQWSVV